MPDDFATALAKSKAPKAPPAFGEALAMARGGGASLRATPDEAATARTAIFGSADPDSQPAPDEMVNAVLDLQGHGQRVESEIAKYSKELDREAFPGIFKAAPSDQALEFERMGGAEGYRKAERALAIERMGGVPTLGKARRMLSVADSEARAAEDEAKIRQSENPILRYGARLAVGFKEQLENAGAYVRENLIRPVAPEAARALDSLSAKAGMSEEGKAIVREDTKGVGGDIVEMAGQTAAFIPQVALGGVPGAAAITTAATGGDVMAGVETAAFLKTAGALTKLFGGASESVVRQVLAEGGAMTAAGVAMRLGFHGDPGTLQQAGVDALSGLAFGVMGGGARAREASAKFKAALEGGKTLEAAAAESGIPAERLKVPPVPEAAWMREAKFETAKDVMPTETPIAPKVPRPESPTPGFEAPVLEVPDAPNLKRGKSATKVMAEVQARAEAKAPVDEALRRFEERTGIKVAPESTPTEKPVSVAPKAPAEAPSGTVRFYHGGVLGGDGGRWLTPSREYAAEYAKKSPGGRVGYVDLPRDHHLVVASREASGVGPEMKDTPGAYTAFEAPPEVAARIRPLDAEAPRATPKAEPAPVEAPKPKPVKAAPPPVEAPRPEGVSIKNAAVEADRAARGAEPLPETKPEKMADWKDEAIRRVEENPNYPVELIERLKRTGSPHDKVEAAALTVHRVKLNESLAKAEADVLKAADRGDMDGVKEAKIRADNLRAQDYEVSELVGKAAGAEAARALGARAMALDNQYDLLPMETRRRVVNDGAPLTEKQKAETKALHEKFVEAQALAKKAAGPSMELLEGKRPDIPKVSVADVKGAEYGRRNTIVTRETYDATRAALRDKLNRMSAGIDPTLLVDLAKIGAFHLEAGLRNFAGWSKAMIEDMGEVARPHLREIWRAARLSMGDPGKPQAERLKAMTSRLEMAAADYNARVATGNLKKATREPVVMNKAAIEAEAKMIDAKRRWEAALLRDEWQKKNLGQKALSLTLSGLHNIPRAIMAGLDLSATLLQGGPRVLGAPVAGARALATSIKSFRSVERADRSEAQIRLDPQYHDAKAAKLFLAEHNTHSPKNMEEIMLTGWLSKIPLLAGSQRAYVAFMNRLRFDWFKAGVASLSKNGAKPTPEEMRGVAALVNTFTGRAGDVNSRALNGAAAVFWAPRLVLSRFQMLTGYPLLASKGAVRKLAAREYARYAIGLGLIYGMARLSGKKVDDDGKIDLGGGTKIDPTSGLSSAFRFLKQMGGAAVDSVRGKDTDNTKNAPRNIGRFLRYKLAPLPGATVSTIAREDAVGNKTDLKTEAIKLIRPLSYKDTKAAFEEHNVPEAVMLSILNILGVRVSEKPAKGR